MTIANQTGIGTIVSVIVNVLNHGLIFLITAFIIYNSGFKTGNTDLHAVFCTIGYVLLMSESLMVLTPENIWSRQISNYRNRSHIHWILQILGAAFNIAGGVLIFMNKKKHFTSYHGILGIASIAIMCFLCMSGITLFYTVKLKQFFRPVVFKFIHSFLGIACFVLGIATQCLGYDKKWIRRNAGTEIVILLIVLTAISAFICILRPIQSVKSHLKAALRL